MGRPISIGEEEIAGGERKNSGVLPLAALQNATPQAAAPSASLDTRRQAALRASLALTGTLRLVWCIQRPASGAPCQRCKEIERT